MLNGTRLDPQRVEPDKNGHGRTGGNDRRPGASNNANGTSLRFGATRVVVSHHSRCCPNRQQQAQQRRDFHERAHTPQQVSVIYPAAVYRGKHVPRANQRQPALAYGTATTAMGAVPVEAVLGDSSWPLTITNDTTLLDCLPTTYKKS